MFLLGHTGIGSTLAAPLTRPIDRRWVLLGTLLPDLIDKPLYYGLAFATGRHAADLGLISGTRTIGHTLALALVVLAAGLLSRRRPVAAVAIGMVTHLLLDECGDLYTLLLPGAAALSSAGPPTLAAIFFPLLGAHFPVMPYRDASQHLGSIRNLYVISGEVIGAALLTLHWWRGRARLGSM